MKYQAIPNFPTVESRIGLRKVKLGGSTKIMMEHRFRRSDENLSLSLYLSIYIYMYIYIHIYIIYATNAFKNLYIYIHIYVYINIYMYIYIYIYMYIPMLSRIYIYIYRFLKALVAERKMIQIQTDHLTSSLSKSLVDLID